MRMISQAANAQARQILDPIRIAAADALAGAHAALAPHIAQLQGFHVNSEIRLAHTQAQLAALQEEVARLRDERDHARAQAERARKEAAETLAEASRMKESVMPRLVIEHYQLKGEHDALKGELARVKDANRALHEKLQVQTALAAHAQARSAVGVANMFVVPRSESRHGGAGGVKAEAGTEPGQGLQVKEERGMSVVRVKEPSSPAEVDSETASGMSYAIE